MFDPLQTHKYHTHTHTRCLMMGEVSLETSPKNIMIQDMINSKTVLTHKLVLKVKKFSLSSAKCFGTIEEKPSGGRPPIPFKVNMSFHHT